MIHVFLPPADIIIGWLAPPATDKRSPEVARSTCVQGAAAPDTKLLEARGATAGLAWLTRVKAPRAVAAGPRNPTAACSRHARQTAALSTPEAGDTRRTMIKVQCSCQGHVGSRERAPEGSARGRAQQAKMRSLPCFAAGVDQVQAKGVGIITPPEPEENRSILQRKSAHLVGLSSAFCSVQPTAGRSRDTSRVRH